MKKIFFVMMITVTLMTCAFAQNTSKTVSYVRDTNHCVYVTTFENAHCVFVETRTSIYFTMGIHCVEIHNIPDHTPRSFPIVYPKERIRDYVLYPLNAKPFEYTVIGYRPLLAALEMFLRTQPQCIGYP